MQTSQLPKPTGKHLHYYSDFFSRLGAGLLDGLILSPIWVTTLLINTQSLTMNYFMYAFNFIVACIYMIYLPKRYGGTPGKLIAGLKIIKTDGSDLDWISAFNRYSVSMALAFFTTSGTIYALTQADPETFDSLSWIEKSQYLQSFNWTYHIIFLWISCAWTLADIIVFFTNDKFRALHDMIGGTVVIKKLYHDKIKEHMAGDIPPTEPAEPILAQ